MSKKVIATAAATAILLLGIVSIWLSSRTSQTVETTVTKESKSPKKVHSKDLAEIRTLQQQLVSTLDEAVGLLKAEREIGAAPYSEVLVAQSQLFEAKLDMASTVDEQIAMLEKLVELQREVDREVKTRVEVGSCKPSTEKIVQSHRLKAEIALAKLKAAHP